MDEPANHHSSSQLVTMTTTLPRDTFHTMSDLLEAAIDDARSLDPEHYQPVSYAWHSPDEDGPCQVCLAGSLIAKSLQGSPHQMLTPYRFSEDTQRMLQAVDYMRNGNWYLAFIRFYGFHPSCSFEYLLGGIPAPSNSDFVGWHAFRAHLDSLQAILPELRRIESLRD